MNVIDAHQHYWRVQRGDYGWLASAPAVLKRDFLPFELNPHRAAAGVERAILVQAAPTEAETRFLFELARADRAVAGVVGWVDFEAPDVEARIAALVRDGDGLLVGLRPMAQDIEDPDWLARPALDAAFASLQRHGLAFDALVRPDQLPGLLARLERETQLRAVLDHGGKPVVDGASGFDGWAAQIALLAARTSLHCKLSGLLTQLAPGVSEHALAPYVDHLFACFGPQRLIWGSDWPVVTLRGDYARWIELARSYVRRLAAGHETAIFGGTAAAFYRLAQPSPSARQENPP
ncbi:amidohydrolase family protein [Dyella sp. BiH032]|uniref:amidohydrolase family protein n=1 Tax=Dyella sp. BiH032 TaxID=3075430 RepID=UPI002892A9AE|nr:amidohydrolase family protein [Dyella sp. BiH032]WNL44674.1 amidohydrolase family protein [Dyella sp. BiH032]